MKISLLGLLIFCLITFSYAQTDSRWELSESQLDMLITNSDVVITGKVKQNYKKIDISIIDPLQGPQRLKKISFLVTPTIKQYIYGIEKQSEYICFLKKQNDKFVPFSKQSFIKKDMFLFERVKKEVIKWRVKRADQVVIASVQSLTEKVIEKGKVLVVAQCETLTQIKGVLPKIFMVQYIRVPNSSPPTLFLFKNLSYIFFIKQNKKNVYDMINSYEGAYAQRYHLIRLLKQVTRSENKFDELAGKSVDGIRILARAQQEIVKQNEDVVINVIIQNVSQNNLEMYHNNISYFILYHIINSNGKLINTKYPKKNSVPSIEKEYFMTLSPGTYFATPPLRLPQYLKPDVYSIYVEFHLPWKYAGKTIGKAAWSGKVISHRVKIQVKE